jgi:hypothetical protein
MTKRFDVGVKIRHDKWGDGRILYKQGDVWVAIFHRGVGAIMAVVREENMRPRGD